jgi:serine/threonine protein kinase
MQNDFDREVKFMRSCRHPHVLTFYGAGIDTDHRAFLVTELMSCSLKPMLRDRKRPLDWATRITFTVDIAKGMQCKPLSTPS